MIQYLIIAIIFVLSLLGFGARLSRYLNQKTLKSFIYRDKEEGHFEPIECYKGGILRTIEKKNSIFGYENIGN